jgi:hypothetical protein
LQRFEAGKLLPRIARLTACRTVDIVADRKKKDLNCLYLVAVGACFFQHLALAVGWL